MSKMFRDLSANEKQSFRAWARENYIPLSPITDRALAPRYLVTDCAFNRANYLSLIGTMHDANSIPSYAAIREITCSRM